MTVAVNPLGAVGAEVTGIDLRQLAPAQTDELKSLLGRYGVLFFREQQLSPHQQIAVAEAFGTINVNRFFRSVADYPQIAEVRKEPDQTVNIGGGWHTDHSYDQIPALGSLLYARELPPLGGDTLFASTCRAYDTLSDGLRQTLQGLRAVHSSRHVFGAQSAYVQGTGGRLGNAGAAIQDAVHPVVIRHPLSGRPCLYVNPAFTVQFEGWTAQESMPLLEMLYRHIARPEHTIRFRWQPGSLAFWDNRSTWHFAVNDYHGERRLLHRITLEGESLAAWTN